MRKPVGILALAILLISRTGLGMPGAADRQPEKFFRDYVGLSDDQIRDIGAGKAIAKVLESPTPEEVFVFGAVYINSTPERYLKLAADIDALRTLPNYLALQEFSNPPRLADLHGFVLDEKDLDELQHCKPSHCDVQLPTEAMNEFQSSVNWTAPDRPAQANHLAQQMALEGLLQYQLGGNTALGTYRDKSHPTAVAETFASLLHQMKALPVYLPELERYLLDYPNAQSNQIASEFYWEKVNFGLKPTLRIVQALIYRGASPDQPACAMATGGQEREFEENQRTLIKDADYPHAGA
ncbi:MAG TPA: hypothetical protein VLL05_04895 [Terriglobales bacterium]|nr:hypothetical protein [Terriglobales bacterium]